VSWARFGHVFRRDSRLESALSLRHEPRSLAAQDARMRPHAPTRGSALDLEAVRALAPAQARTRALAGGAA
jgi:hypothetical protein